MGSMNEIIPTLLLFTAYHMRGAARALRASSYV